LATASACFEFLYEVFINRGVGMDVAWMPAADGERQAIRVDSRATDGAYAVIESVAQPGVAVPTHLHRNEAEHFLVLSGHYLVAVDDEVIDAPAGARVTIPRNTPHSWRNVSGGEGRLVVTIVPGGFEQLAHLVKDTPPARLHRLAAQFGCEILGPPGV
jgi:mannose-6-phosphate isomerase-like protein (cupin superfamily)